MGNAGDSRCIASVNGQAEALSTDHKPSDPLERERIEKAGGFVEFNRVNGNLALSRAVGDFAFKSNQSLKAEDQVNIDAGKFPMVSHDFVILSLKRET